MSENIKIVSATIECWRCSGPCAPEHCPNCGNRKIVNGTRIIEEALRKKAPTPDAKLIAAAANFAITSLLGAAAVLDDVPGKSPNARDCRQAADALAAALAERGRV